MIQTETVTINGVQYEHVWSDANRLICRGEQSWTEVYNPLNTGRTYTEGDEMPEEEAAAEEVLSILLGGTDD